MGWLYRLVAVMLCCWGPLAWAQEGVSGQLLPRTAQARIAALDVDSEQWRLPDRASRDELAQQLLELALADVHPLFNRLWLRLSRDGQTARSPAFYAELYLTLKVFRQRWHALDWDSRERIRLDQLDFSASEAERDAYRQALLGGSLWTHVSAMRPAVPRYLETRQQLHALLAEARRQPWERGLPSLLLHPGESHPAMSRIKLLLERLGDLEPGQEPTDELYSYELEPIIRHFQRRHGLQDDGVIGPRTLSWLRVSPQSRAVILARSLLRRDIPIPDGPRYVLVNLPEYRLRVMEAGAEIFSSRVIVGQLTRQTPLLSSRIASVVLNPPWGVPRSILQKDILPKLEKDPAYLQKEQFDILNYQGVAVDPLSIAMPAALRDGFPYQLRQRPGDHNALGRYKFYLPNNEAIYLHATPSHRLFEADKRTISSGCVRVERAPEFAALLLEGSRWSPERVEQILQETKTKWLPLRQSVPIRMVYWRSWLDDEGWLQFRDDIYGLDADASNGNREVMATLLSQASRA